MKIDTFPNRAADIAKLVASGALSCESVIQHYLEQIDRLEESVQAWEFIDANAALSRARELDRSSSMGPLRGVPIGIKDVIDTSDMPTAYGSSLYRGFRPAADATCVALLRKAGAIILGKTVSTEFAHIAPPKTRNPHNIERTPGGSSSGSAAAVAAGMVPLALGTQTFGSTIRPASFCGVIGFRPSFGLCDMAGIKTLARSLDTVGLFGVDVRDTQLMLSVLSEDLAPVPLVELKSLRVAVVETNTWGNLQPEAQLAMDVALRAFSTSGSMVRAVTGSQKMAGWLTLHENIADWEILQSLAYERLFRRAEVDLATQEVFAAYEASALFTSYSAAQSLACEARNEIAAVFNHYDVIVSPAAFGEAPSFASTGDSRLNRAWSMLHVPCVTLPAARGPAGLPVGVQLIGRFGNDRLLLAIAAKLEDALREDLGSH